VCDFACPLLVDGGFETWKSSAILVAAGRSASSAPSQPPRSRGLASKGARAIIASHRGRREYQ
jgi:hypothetical protein